MTTSTPMAALPAPGTDRPRNLLATGVALACAGATMFFAALLAAYVHLRGAARGANWPPEGVEFDIYLGNLLVITMLLGSLSAQWGVSAVKRGEIRQGAAAFGVALGFGLAFLNLLSYTIAQAEFFPGSHAYGAVTAAMALTLGLVVGVAVGFVTFTLLRVSGGHVGPDNPDQARATAWLYHYATLASIIVWFAVIVRK